MLLLIIEVLWSWLFGKVLQIICTILVGLAGERRSANGSGYVQNRKFMMMWRFPSIVIIA